MNRILTKKKLNPTVTLLEIEAPRIAKKALAGQFIILRADERGERIPLTVAGCDLSRGSVTVIFQIVGGATMSLERKQEGDFIADFVGPLGNPTEVEKGNALVVGGGVGCAIALPVARRLKEIGASVTSVIGFRSRDLVILEEEFCACSDECVVTTDDGTYGEHGNVCVPLKRFLDKGKVDVVYAVGPLVMMKFVAQTTKEYGVRTIASMNPIMIDGTGMCGGCRLTVGGQTKFACVDGPDFDAHLVDFDEAIRRAGMYREFEQAARERHCRLYQL